MTKTQTTTKLALLAGATALAALAPQSHAQSSDALIDKLVDKGILTVSEAKDLRVEADKDFKTALQAKTGMPDWVTGYKISGDIRGRYEAFNYDADNGARDRNRFRYRLRAGFAAVLNDDFEVGMRLGSGDLDGGIGNGIDPLSNNQTFQNNGSKKGIFLDLAYGKWSPIHNSDWDGTLTVGKLENPFVYPTTMMFDKDYTPEGATVELTHRFNSNHSLKFTGGGFVLDERDKNRDNPYAIGAQLRWDATWTKHIASSFGVSGWSIGNSGGDNLATNNVPAINYGNARNGSGQLLNKYTPVQVDASVTYTFDKFPLYNAPCPLTVFGEFINNPEVSQNNQGSAIGVTLGKSGKRGLWDLSWQYRELQADAWYDNFTESDFGANYGGSIGPKNGTNVRGNILRAQYSPTDSLTLAVTYWLTDLINETPGVNSGTRRLQVDASLKF